MHQTLLRATTTVHNIFADFENCLSAAVKHIRLGNVIAIPTDTIYGLAADAENMEAVRKLYRIKDRHSSKAVAICVHDTQSIERWGLAEYVPEEMLQELLPGPVTIVLKKTSRVNSELNPNDKKIAVRIPKYEFVQKLTAALQKPVALSSANKSGNVSSVTVDEFSYLWPRLDAVFDGGTTGASKAGSTIVDLLVSLDVEAVLGLDNGSFEV
jgi:tRNA threonylcarbamoyl adenosine modification protein (Sua5/YciO/YrdC/YwlC family)